MTLAGTTRMIAERAAWIALLLVVVNRAMRRPR
jgi:hypothetical protein